jgi:hypothetical protein
MRRGERLVMVARRYSEDRFYTTCRSAMESGYEGGLFLVTLILMGVCIYTV